MILANGCNITKSEKFKGVWILSVPTVYLNLYHMTLEDLKYNKLVASTTYIYDTFLVLSILFEAWKL